MEIESTIISACITIFALVLLAISYGSYRKHKSQKLLIISIVFFIFLLKGILLSLSMFLDELMFLNCSPYLGAFDLIMLLLLFISTLKR